jgi:hypothetical protein
MIRVLIRSLPDIGAGKAVTIGMVNLHTSRQLQLLRSSSLMDVHATLYRPIPFEDEPWRSVEVHDFDPALLGPYDLAYQALKAAVAGRTADPRSALAEPGEPSSLLWWQQPA